MNQKVNEVSLLKEAILDLAMDTNPTIATVAVIFALAQIIAETVKSECLDDAVWMAQEQIAELVEKNWKQIEADRKMWN